MKRLISILFLFPFLCLHADEGMWMLGRLSQKTKQLMTELGLKVPFSELYTTGEPSLKDAIVSFGGFCSGVVVSQEGLVFTNHHCGFDAIQQHSSVEHDYLKNGFVARGKGEELPNPDLYVSFLIRTEEVTARVLEALAPDMNENQRRVVVDSVSLAIQSEIYEKDSLLYGVVNSYYEGNEYYLSVYKNYYDVRLVFAPPSSVGKFGGDTDNWVWPRHTGDFSVFRIYAGKDNEPAAYSPENVPYRPAYVPAISLKGYEEGTFCMTLGYPGSTERYLSSFGIKERMEAINTALIDIRAVKQAIWKEVMKGNDSIRIKYASKYATSANYWKNSIGMNKAIEKLHVIEKKQELERLLKRWIQEKPDERGKYLHILTELELNYRNRFETVRASAFFGESFMNAPEVIGLGYQILNFDFSDDSLNVSRKVRDLEKKYDNLDLSVDKRVFIAMLKEYREKVPASYLPDVYATIDSQYKGDYMEFADYIYSHSNLTSPKGFRYLAERDSTFNLIEDPITVFVLDLIVKSYDMGQSMDEITKNIERNERLLNEAMREMREEGNFYPDANSTMRLSIGIVGGYSPKDAVKYNYYTTAKGVFEKVAQYKGNPDFEVQPALLDLLSKQDFGKYADSSGNMNICFISDNDITGGNSGSGMFNGEGQLIGLAFDGNWEAMSGDILFEPNLQRCVGVDIRYMLFLIEKYGEATHLIEELQLY